MIMIMSRAVASSTNMMTHPERKSRSHVLVHVIIRKNESRRTFWTGKDQVRRRSVILLDRTSQYWHYLLLCPLVFGTAARAGLLDH